MTNKRTIGELTGNGVRRQQISITEFAKMICCQRNNVCDIFKRNKMGIAQLKQISKILDCNFLKEFVEDAGLINDGKESEEEVMKQKTVSQFLNVIPGILRRLGKSSAIVSNRLGEPRCEDCPTLDFGLSNHFTTFTMGETLKERIGNRTAPPITPAFGDGGCMVGVCTSVVYRSVCVDVKLDCKTADE